MYVHKYVGCGAKYSYSRSCNSAASIKDNTNYYFIL